MKQYVLKPGEKGVSALEIREMTERGLKPYEVSVRIHAASLNYRDLITANQGVKRELVPLSDGAGTVEEIGEGVTRLQRGDRVVGLFFPLWQGGEIDHDKFSSARGGEPTDGMLAQRVYGPEGSFLKFPNYLSFEEASTLPCAGLTAWNALIVKGKLKPSETILIMGTGGVALFALQLAKTLGARVILLSSSQEKIDKARRMGADELINYKENPNWEELVWEKTGGIGADLVLELGGGGTLAKSMACAKINGRISLAGTPTTSPPSSNLLPSVISAFAPTRHSGPRNAPFNTRAPIPIRQSSETVQP
jgi:NADPH:quinone reductase-like Zn-dependent oxidoreductase